MVSMDTSNNRSKQIYSKNFNLFYKKWSYLRTGKDKDYKFLMKILKNVYFLWKKLNSFFFWKNTDFRMCFNIIGVSDKHWKRMKETWKWKRNLEKKKHLKQFIVVHMKRTKTQPCIKSLRLFVKIFDLCTI